MSKNVKLMGGVIAISSMMFASCSSDEVKEVLQQQDEVISFTTKVVHTRSSETTLETLDGFYVYADADGYKMFIKKEPVNKKEGSVYEMENSRVWPEDVDELRFWAYGPKNLKLIKEPEINYQNQIFRDYIPEKKATDQQDFVVAYKDIEREEATGMAVPLEFHHALSQIEIRAYSPDFNKRVYIKGAWIVNVREAGTLKFDSDMTGEGQHHMNWMAGEVLTSYGWELPTETQLSQKGENGLGDTMIGNQRDKSGLMLVPQTTGKLAFSNGAATNTGAYILLLCRIEAVHVSDVIDADKTELVKVETDGRHLHQLFPPIPDGGKFDDSAYGYTCVPVDIKWEPGKKYIYNLEFCGATSGGGLYPPKDLPDGLPETKDGLTIVDRPADKNPGDHILDNPISFSVTVADWTDARTEKPMD